MKFRYTPYQAEAIKLRGDATILSAVVDETIKEVFKSLVANKEDIRLYQGYMQTLLALKELLP